MQYSQGQIPQQRPGAVMSSPFQGVAAEGASKTAPFGAPGQGVAQGQGYAQGGGYYGATGNDNYNMQGQNRIRPGMTIPAGMGQQAQGQSQNQSQTGYYNSNPVSKEVGGAASTIGGLSMSEIQQLNAPSYFVRPTVSKVPSSASLKQKAHIPVGLVFQPLASPPPGYPEVPTVSFGSSGVLVRCKPCRTYINPFVRWEAGGRRWICNMCGYSNETLSFYYCGLDDQGRRTDRFERPELSVGSTEFIASGEYMVRPPQPPVYFVVLDVSMPAVSSGLVETVCLAVKNAILSDGIPGGGRALMGIITYDSCIHFYDLNSNLSQPHMFVVSDLNDLFLPLSDGVLVNIADSTEVSFPTHCSISFRMTYLLLKLGSKS